MIATIGTPEILLIAGAVILLFGARKLPELGRAIGQSLREFKKSFRGSTPEEPEEEGEKEEEEKEQK